MITEEQATQIKEHLLKQLENFPEDKREQIKNQINSMTTEQIEEFVKQNQLTHLGGQCIFCSIVANKTPSYKIDEDKDNIAILDINPLSKGQTLIIPKEHLEKLPQSTKDLSQKIAQKLNKKFKPKEINIKELKIMNHPLIEVTPIYGNETEKHQATEEELKDLQEEITKKEEQKLPTSSLPSSSYEIPILPPRIP